jgi:hypothetical protein
MLAQSLPRKTPLTSFGDLFYAIYDEIQDMTLMETLSLLLELFISTVKKVFILSEEKVKELFVTLLFCK